MSQHGTRSTFTVYFDDQFWVGLYERVDNGQLTLCRLVFGPEPTMAELAVMMSGREWSRMRFLEAATAEKPAPSLAANPKRRQREAAKHSRATAPSTASQEALKRAIEARKVDAGDSRREASAAQKRERWLERVAKRKKKRRGH